ncbi:MAG: O-methyltransferase [Myxococcota bacterium]
MPDPYPRIVAEAQARAAAVGFEFSCEPGVGRLLAVLAAAARPGGRILELGTGVGVGLAWLVHGLGERRDVELISVDLDAGIQSVARQGSWPPFVCFELGDGAERVRELGRFELIFPDAPGGKLFGLPHTIDALAPGGVLLADDMDLARHEDPGLRSALVAVRRQLHAHPELLVSELDTGSGVVLAARRSS